MAWRCDESGLHALGSLGNPDTHASHPPPSSLSLGVGPAVLVIDDDALVRRSLTRALRRRYTVTDLRDAETALALLEQGNRFVAILCDLHLSGKSGRQFLLEVEEMDPAQAARIIILSGSPRAIMDDEFLELIASRFLEKPAGLPEIEEMLASLVTEERAA